MITWACWLSHTTNVMQCVDVDSDRLQKLKPTFKKCFKLMRMCLSRQMFIACWFVRQQDKIISKLYSSFSAMMINSIARDESCTKAAFQSFKRVFCTCESQSFELNVETFEFSNFFLLYSQKILPQLLIYVFISLCVLIYCAIELCKTKTKLSDI